MLTFLWHHWLRVRVWLIRSALVANDGESDANDGSENGQAQRQPRDEPDKIVFLGEADVVEELVARDLIAVDARTEQIRHGRWDDMIDVWPG